MLSRCWFWTAQTFQSIRPAKNWIQFAFLSTILQTWLKLLNQMNKSYSPEFPSYIINTPPCLCTPKTGEQPHSEPMHPGQQTHGKSGGCDQPDRTTQASTSLGSGSRRTQSLSGTTGPCQTHMLVSSFSLGYPSWVHTHEKQEWAQIGPWTQRGWLDRIDIWPRRGPGRGGWQWWRLQTVWFPKGRWFARGVGIGRCSKLVGRKRWWSWLWSQCSPFEGAICSHGASGSIGGGIWCLITDSTSSQLSTHRRAILLLLDQCLHGSSASTQLV